ncbi:MAG: hypothetical protein WC924_03505 [Candidatus Gracilibacteria bacterium]
MKKHLALFLALVLLMPACTPQETNDNNEELEALHEQVADLEQQLEEKENEESVDPAVEAVVVEEEYTGESTIELVSPTDSEHFHEEPVIFTGTVSPNTTKIVATAHYYDSFDASERSTDVYTLTQFTPGDTTFTYRAKMEWDNLGYGESDYLFTAYFDDGRQKAVNVTIYFDPGGLGKPVIYLYPEKPTQVSVSVTPEQGVFVSDPEMGDGWTVMANPKGALFNLADHQYYPYLFWEAYADPFPTFKDGFVVSQTGLKKFFDEKLTYMGLNAKEITDFEEYWLAKLTEKPYYFIHFVDQKLLDEYAPLNISPAPDSILRVFFDYDGLDAFKQVPMQKLTPWSRSGFSVVEWGGSLFN